MKKLGQKGFSAIELVLLLSIGAILAGLSWYIFTGSKPTDNQPVVLESDTRSSEPAKLISLNITSLPDGWVSNVSEDTQVSIQNNSVGCSIDVARTSDATGATVESLTNSTVEAIESKGYTVERLTGEQVAVTTPNGNKVIDATSIKLGGPDSTKYQKYGYIINDESVVQVQLTCNEPAGFDQVNTAISTITVNY